MLTIKYLSTRSFYGIRIPLVWIFCAYLIGLSPLVPIHPGKRMGYLITLLGISLAVLSICIDWFAGRPGIGISQLILLSVGLSLMVFGIISIFDFKIQPHNKLFPLMVATSWALISSFSWHVLAQNHMACHPGLNAIIFYLPFGITVFIQIGYWFQIISQGLRISVTA
jgi:hypothetical protein